MFQKLGISFIVLFISAWAPFYSFAQVVTPAPSTQVQIQTKSQEIADLEKEIAQYGNEIVGRQSKQRTLKNDIATLDAKIKKSLLEIRRLSLVIEGLLTDIKEHETAIASAEKIIGEKKNIIVTHLAALDAYDRLPRLAIFIANARFSDFLNALHALELVEGKIYEALMAVKEQKIDLEEEKISLEEDKVEHEQLKSLQIVQKETLAKQQNDKQYLLTVTKGEEKKFQEMVKLSKANVEKLKNEIYYLQRIGVTAEQAATLGVLVAGRIGIRPAFLIAILEIESRMGANVGKGTYLADMHPRDHEAFLQICRELGLDPNTTPVSKKPSYGWGGAMGPAQFLPTTWLGYRARVTSYTGRPANPWNIEDAFFAAAIKLGQDGASSKTTSGELAAAKAYIGGSPYCSKSICNYYANLAIEKAADIEKTL
ncbi:MAG: lytic murein transglycosylase [bacterium]|nr:lytic murein transglycosylase [bacterium]